MCSSNVGDILERATFLGKSFTEFKDDVLGFDGSRPEAPVGVAAPKRISMGPVPVLGGAEKGRQRRAEITALKERQRRDASKRSGKSMLTIGRGKAPQMFVGGTAVQPPRATGGRPRIGVNY